MYVVADFMNFCCVGLHFSTFSIIPFTLNCVTWLPVSYLFRHALKNALISLFFFYYSIYFELFYISASLAPFSARINVRSFFSNMSVILFLLSCVTWLPVLYLFRHASKNAFISLIFLFVHLLWIVLHQCCSLAPFSARINIRPHFSNFSIIPFTLNCITSVLVSRVFQSALKYALISPIY